MLCVLFLTLILVNNIMLEVTFWNPTLMLQSRGYFTGFPVFTKENLENQNFRTQLFPRNWGKKKFVSSYFDLKRILR